MVDPVRAASLTVDRWMLPGELARAARSVDDAPPGDGPAGDAAPAGPAPRTARDWAVDVTTFVVAVAVGFSEYSTFVDLLQLPAWLRIVDPVLGAALCLSLWWRRRFPVTLAITGALASSMSNTATGALFVLLFSVALHRGWQWAVPIGLGTVLLGVPYIVTYFTGALGPPVLVLLVVLLAAALVVASGLGVRARRQLVLALRMRADDDRREQARLLAESRRTEREQIAREMHDVLAHRISLLSVHAGALEYRTAMAENGTAPPPTAAEVHSAVSVVRTNAHQALEELREVLHLLRQPAAEQIPAARTPAGTTGDGLVGAGCEESTAAPQPTADRLPALVEEARRSGQPVHADLGHDTGGALATARPQLQRTVYRVVQEGLTNARKHAPGTEVEVLVLATPGVDVVVEVANPVPIGVTTSEIPGAGSGLTGLAERVALHGGDLTREIRDGRFLLRARMPWAS